MDNINKLQKNASESNRVGKGQDPVAVEKFGFPVATCCGFIPQNNEWHDDWVVSVAGGTYNQTQFFFNSIVSMLPQIGEFVVHTYNIYYTFI